VEGLTRAVICGVSSGSRHSELSYLTAGCTIDPHPAGRW
jgi:hypothetical protein